jgi:hypothetical protein
VWSDLQVSKTFPLVVEAGPGIKLLPTLASQDVLARQPRRTAAAKSNGSSRFGQMDEAASYSESMIFVTDSHSSDRNERQLIPDGEVVEVCLYDEWGNVAKTLHDESGSIFEFSSRDYVCACHIRFNSHDDSVGDGYLALPSLKGANKFGFLKGELVSAGTFRFSALALKEFEAEGETEAQKRGVDSLELNLVFSLLRTRLLNEPEAPGGETREKVEVKAHRVLFTYSRDESLQQVQRKRQEKLVVSAWVYVLFCVHVWID